jgi:HSP20 family protein
MNKLITWNPFGEVDELQNRLGRFFLSGFPNRMGVVTRPGNGDSLELADWSPLVDITETDQEYLFKADLPEMKKDDVKVTVENGMLTISGERKVEREEKNTKFHRIERSFGRFLRTFTIPEDADASKIAADFKDGVLRVHLPKSAVAKKPKPIQVKVQ